MSQKFNGERLYGIEYLWRGDWRPAASELPSLERARALVEHLADYYRGETYQVISYRRGSGGAMVDCRVEMRVRR